MLRVYKNFENTKSDVKLDKVYFLLSESQCVEIYLKCNLIKSIEERTFWNLPNSQLINWLK